jgi:hypothetical protein
MSEIAYAGRLENLMSQKLRGVTFGLLLLVSVIAIAACGKSDNTDKPSASVFASPDDAGNALVAAIKSGDQNSLVQIFGPDSKDVISSGDAVQDKNNAATFAAGYGTMHRWRKIADGAQVLLVGADNFPFAVPLKKNAGGQWFFDTAAGKDEFLSRRIGRNELAIIDACRAVADAQNQYFSELHDGETTKQYASKFLSDPGKHNGLYWESPQGKPESPLGPLAAFAASEGYNTRQDAHMPFHGYYFRALKGQSDKAPSGAKQYLVGGKMTGGFALVAYPAEYGNSGVMTFIINQDGLLLQKDLGKKTTETATAMSEYDPDTGWNPVDNQ